jgi:hypothetical protein
MGGAEMKNKPASVFVMPQKKIRTCKHRSALFLEKRKRLSLLVCNICRQPFWKDGTGKEIKGQELVAILESKPAKKSRLPSNGAGGQ